MLTVRNWLMHRWPDNVDHPVQIDLLRRLLAEFESHEYLFAVHEDFDRSLIEALKIPADRVVDSKDWGEYVGLYTDPENVVLALRLHAGMLAVANGVPTIFVGHDTRTYAFCELLGIECIDLFATDCAARCIRRLQSALSGDRPPRDERAERQGLRNRASPVPALVPSVFPQLRGAVKRFLAANELPVNAGQGLRNSAGTVPALVPRWQT